MTLPMVSSMSLTRVATNSALSLASLPISAKAQQQALVDKLQRCSGSL